MRTEGSTSLGANKYKTKNHTQITDRITAGIAGAIVAFPLSIGFALIAGVPEEIMIQASIYAALLNAIFASSRYGIAGPNTAVALITGAAIAPFAPREGEIYMGYVFALCIMVALSQFIISLVLRKIDIMDYVSNTVIDGLTFGIGAIFILNSLNMAAGLSPDITNQWIIFNAFTSSILIFEGDANYYAIVVALTTITIGFICWRIDLLKRFAIPIAITAGFFIGNVMGLFQATRIDQVGWLDLTLFTTTLPDFRPVSWPVIMELIGPAIAIALIGTLQTLSIAKGLRDPGSVYNPSRETFSQGFQHLFMGFFQGCPVSNSYNKSTLQYNLKGDKYSFVIAAIFTLIFVMAFGNIVAAIPMPALAGCMILVGLSMMSLKKHRHHFQCSKTQSIVFVTAACAVVVLSIPAAIFIGALLSIALHLFSFAKPQVTVSRRNYQFITVAINGILFYISGAKINKTVQIELENINYKTAQQVFVDFRKAQIISRDKIEMDWMHNLLQLNIPVTIIATTEQKHDLETLQLRGSIPAKCLLVYMEIGDERELILAGSNIKSKTLPRTVLA